MEATSGVSVGTSTSSASGTHTTSGASTSGSLSSGTTADTGTDTGDATNGLIFDVGNGADLQSLCSEGCEATSADGGGDGGLWLLNASGGKLWRVDVESGESAPLCNLSIDLPYASLTFTRDDVLLASAGDTLYHVDPCSCEVTEVGPYTESFSGVNGITPNQDMGIFGLSSVTDQLGNIDAGTAVVNVIGDLGTNFGVSGLTWSHKDQKLYSISSTGSASLYTIDHITGVASNAIPLSISFSTVGIEIHPVDNKIYACSGALPLLEVDRVTGEITYIGSFGTQVGGGTFCNNLGAPWQGACLPAQ